MPLTAEVRKCLSTKPLERLVVPSQDEEETNLQTPAQVASRSTEARLADMKPMDSVPKSVTLEDIKAIHHENFSSDGMIDFEQFTKAIEKDDLESMRDLLVKMLANEAYEGKYNYKSRKILEYAITNMKANCKGITPISTVEIYGKWEPIFKRDPSFKPDPFYSKRIEALAEGDLLIYPEEIIPRSGRKWEGKQPIRVPIVGGYMIPQRREVTERVKEQLLKEYPNVTLDRAMELFGTPLSKYEAAALLKEISKLKVPEVGG
jgi:hypothetical protein